MNLCCLIFNFLKILNIYLWNEKSSLKNNVTGCVIPENQAKILIKCEIVGENIYKDMLNEILTSDSHISIYCTWAKI